MVTKASSAKKPGKPGQIRLTEAEELARVLMRSAGTGVFIVQEGKFQYVNSLFQELAGYTEEELLGKYSLALVHPEDRETVRKKAIENLKGHSSFPYEYRFIKKNGEAGWVLGRVTSAEYKGKPAAIGSFMDITERKRAEEALRESEKKYRDWAELLPQIVFEMDLQGNITFMNRNGLDFLGYTQEDLEEGLNYIQLVVPGDRERIAKNFQRTLAGEKTAGIEYTGLKKDGGTFTFIGDASTFTQENKVIGLRGFVIDISELKKAQERIRLFSDAVESSINAIAVTDLDGKHIYVNPAWEKMWGYSFEEATKMTIRQFVASEELGKLTKEILPSIREKGGYVGEALCLRENRTKFPVSFSASLVKDEKGKPIAMLSSFIDITERKRAEQEREALLEVLEKINRKLEQSNKEL